MKSDPFDFNVFQAQLFLSLRTDAPTQDTLREVMAAILGKALDYSDYAVVAHVFVNQSLGEGHAMIVRRTSEAEAAIDALGQRRNGLRAANPFERLPIYRRFDVDSRSVEIASLVGKTEPLVIQASGELFDFFCAAESSGPATTDAELVAEGQEVIVVPLIRQQQRRLGSLVFRVESGSDAQLDEQTREALIEFGSGVSRLISKLFRSIYAIGNHTYLPSYCIAQSKGVALLCAEVRHFDDVARILKDRSDMSDENQRACLRELVNCFSETVAQAVDQCGGRLDQLWGGGLIAVFGEYMDSPRDVEIEGCIRALQAAAQAVRDFERAKQVWLEECFQFGSFIRNDQRRITTAVAAAVCFGGVQLDYVGGRDHKVYMAFGDTVSFVRALATRACRTELDAEDDLRLRAPILVAQTVYHRAQKDCIRDAPNEVVGSVGQEIDVRLTGLPGTYPVYALFPEHVLLSP